VFTARKRCIAEIVLCKAKPAENSGSICKGFNAAECNFCRNLKGDGKFWQGPADFLAAVVPLRLAKNSLFLSKIFLIAFLVG
jgi:hypothetical protein